MSDDSGRQQVQVHYVKSNQFRVIHVDGVHGGITPHLKLQMGMFSERRAIPKLEVLEVDPQTNEVREVRDKREGKEGFVREVEIEAVMDIDTAETVSKWLAKYVEQARAIEEQRKS